MSLFNVYFLTISTEEKDVEEFEEEVDSFIAKVRVTNQTSLDP